MASAIFPLLSLRPSSSSSAPPSSHSPTSSPPPLIFSRASSSSCFIRRCHHIGFRQLDFKSLERRSSVIGGERFVCRAAEYRFPDPIPEFADAETEKFKNHLLSKLSKKVERYGDSVDQVVGVCTEIFSTFLHSEYGGPGTLMVVPFCDMADTINERGLPGGSQAARAAIKWAQEHVDKDWKEWTGDN